MSKLEFKNFYLVNKLSSGLVMKGGYLAVKVGAFVKILEDDLKHPDVLDAINKGWAEIHTSEPDVSQLPQAPKPIIEVEQYRGMTAEELQASNAAEPEKNATANVEAIGRNTELDKSSNAASVRLGQSAEEANGAKKGRKAADKAADAPAAE